MNWKEIKKHQFIYEKLDKCPENLTKKEWQYIANNRQLKLKLNPCTTKKEKAIVEHLKKEV